MAGRHFRSEKRVSEKCQLYYINREKMEVRLTLQTLRTCLQPVDLEKAILPFWKALSSSY